MYYNRTLNSDFAAHFKSGGKLNWLIEFVKSEDDLDFFIGKNNSGEWVSIYRGLTRIISISLKGTDSILVYADKKYLAMTPSLYGIKCIEKSFNEDIKSQINIIKSNKEFHYQYDNCKEGYYQTQFSRKFGICGSHSNDFIILDKEVVLGYDNDLEREKHLTTFKNKYQDHLGKMIFNFNGKYANNLNKKRLGNELDFLALDKNGNLLLIEFKHGTNTSGIYLSPLQIGMYNDIFNSISISELETAVFAMLKQKKELGLINPSWTMPTRINKIIPVLVISDYSSRSSAKTKFNEILNFSKQHLGQDFLLGLQSYHFTKDKTLERWV